jgi:hypothetical protein
MVYFTLSGIDYNGWYNSKVLFHCVQIFFLSLDKKPVLFLAIEPLVMYLKNNLRVCSVASGNYMNVVLLLQAPMSIWKYLFCKTLPILGGGGDKTLAYA